MRASDLRAAAAATVLIALSPGAASASDQIRYAPPPSWVKPALLPATLATPPVGAPVQPVLLDGQSRLGPNGDVFYAEVAGKVLNTAGLASLGNLTEEWDPHTSTLVVHKLVIIRDGKPIDVLASQKFTVLRREANLERAMLDGRLTATLQMTGLQVGDIVDLAMSFTQHDPVLNGRSEGEYDLPFAQLPPELARFRTLWPSSSAVRWRVDGKLAGVAPRAQGQWSELAVDLQRAQVTAPPTGAPARYMTAGRMEFSTFKSWSEVSALEAALFAEAAKLGPASPLKAEAARIKAATPDPEARAALALRLVEEKVRYVLLAMNGGGLTPARADDTWTRRFGDCKGKTALLVALLSELGIEAEPVLANTTVGDGLDQHLPRLDLFDHAIVRARIAGRTYWLDATRYADRDLQKLDRPNYGWVLPLRAAGAELERIEPEAPITPTAEALLSIDASAGKDAPAKVRLDLYAHGEQAYALSIGYGGQPKEQIERALKQSTSQSYSWIEPQAASWDYDPEQGVLRTSIVGTGKLDWAKDQVSGRPTFEVDDSSFSTPDALKRDKSEDAAAPFAVGFPAYERNVVSITLPEKGRGYTFWGKNMDATVNGVRYFRHARILDGVFTMVRSTRALKPEIAASEAEADAAKIKRFDKEPVYLQADAPPAAAPTGEAGSVADGYRLLREHRFDEALAAFDSALNASPDTRSARIGRAQVFAARKDADGVDREFERALAATKDDDVWVFRNWGEVLYKAGASERALATYTRAIQQHPKNADLYTDRAELRKDMKQFGPALEDADQAVRLAPNRASFSVRAAVRAMSGDMEGALADVDAALQFDPEDADDVYEKGAIYERAKQYDRALYVYASARRLAPTWVTPVAAEARVLAQMGRYDDAMRDLDFVVDARPGNASALNERCWMRATLNRDLDKALADCNAALKIAPKAPAYLDSLGMVYLRSGRLDEAIAQYDAALALAPKQSDSLYARGLAKLRKGDKTAGDADLAAAKQISPRIAAVFESYGLKP